MFLQIPVCLLSVLPKEVLSSEGHTGTSLLQLQVIHSATTAKHLLHPLLSLYTDNAPLRHQETPRSSEKHPSGQLGRKEKGSPKSETLSSLDAPGEEAECIQTLLGSSGGDNTGVHSPSSLAAAGTALSTCQLQ